MTLTPFRSVALVIGMIFLYACSGLQKTETPAENEKPVEETNLMQRELFGKLPDGREVYRYVLRNSNGLEVHAINYGGIITHIKAPDKAGNMGDIVLGYDSLQGYLKETPYFGAVVGRYGNRIANGKFSLDGREYTLVQNNNGQHLHGGTKGFDKVFWNIEPQGGSKIMLTYRSADGEEGYPGNLDVQVEYELTDTNELRISYAATTDKKTVVNLTQHTYFNLTGNASSDILSHELQLNADRFIPVSRTLIPLGELAPVKGTPFDFTTFTPVGQRIEAVHPQLQFAGGYDHCWVLSSTDSVKNAGSLYDPSSGRVVEVMTTEPGIQFYSGNFLTGSITGKGGVVYKRRWGLCLETEHFPDSPNQKQFPSVVLNPGETYRTFTAYRFGIR